MELAGTGDLLGAIAAREGIAGNRRMVKPFHAYLLAGFALHSPALLTTNSPHFT